MEINIVGTPRNLFLKQISLKQLTKTFLDMIAGII